MTLVSIDLEGDANNVLEIGLALCSRLSPIESEESYESFTRKNEISCFTIQLRDPAPSRGHTHEHLRFGEEPHGIDNDPEAIISGHLRRYSSDHLVLDDFDSQTELKWASRSCPNLLQLFSAYVDVQKFAADASDNREPSLRHCLRSLGLFDGVSNGRHNQPHRAANDVVYTLASLAALSSRSSDAPPLVIATNAKRPRLFYRRPQPPKSYPFTTQIRTLVCNPLPLELDTAGKVYNYFSSFNPIAAGTELTHKNSPNKEQLSWSWICFSTKDDLDGFLLSTNHATFSGGKKIIVESHYIPEVMLTAEERKAKQLEDRERIQEERRKTRLQAETIVDSMV